MVTRVARRLVNLSVSVSSHATPLVPHPAHYEWVALWDPASAPPGCLVWCGGPKGKREGVLGPSPVHMLGTCRAHAPPGRMFLSRFQGLPLQDRRLGLIQVNSHHEDHFMCSSWSYGAVPPKHTGVCTQVFT